jgi:DNA-binding NtrC family response regulator
MSEKKISILILDDEKRLRDELGEFLSKLGFNTFLAEAPSKAFSILEKNKIDLAILDIRLPEMDGIKVLKIIKEKYPDIEIIMISGHGDMTTVIEAMRLGAFDYFSKPFRLLDVQNSIERTKKYITLQKRLKEVEGDFNLLSSNIIESMGGRQFIGKSHAVKQIISIMSKVAKTDNTSVLVTGESGTVLLFLNTSLKANSLGIKKALLQELQKIKPAFLKKQINPLFSLMKLVICN